MLSSLVTKWALVALKMLPLLVVVTLSAPAWLCWPFLPAAKQQVVLEMAKFLAQWSISATTEQGNDTAKMETTDRAEPDGPQIEQ